MATQVERQHFDEELAEFGNELLRTGADLGHTSQDLLELSRQTLLPEELVDALNSEGPVQTPVDVVENVLRWTTLMLLLGGGVASSIGSYVLSPVLGIFLSRVGAGFLGFVGFPLFELFTIFKIDEEGLADENVRVHMLGMSLAQGLMVGYALSDHYLSAQPLMCLTPFVVYNVFSSFLVQRQHSDRRQAVKLCIGIAFAANIALGFAADLLTMPYIFLSLLYSGFTGFILQHMLHNIHSFDERTHFHLYHVVLFTGLLVLKAFTFGLFGYSSAELEVARHHRDV